MPRIPASIRNKNPGAMYPGWSARKFGSNKYEVLRSKDGVHKIATFPTSVQGAAAQYTLLASKSYTGRSIQSAIAKWCGGFYVSSYIRILESQAGVTRNTTLTRELLENPDVAIPLCKAMALQEAGRKYPLDDDGWLKAHQLAFPNAVAIPVEVEDLPQESSEPAQESFTEDNANPSPKPQTRVTEAVKGSRTIMGSLAALFGGVVSFFETAMKTLMDAAAQVTEWSAISGMFAVAGANVKGIGFGLVVGGVVLAVTRRLQAANDGKIG